MKVERTDSSVGRGGNVKDYVEAPSLSSQWNITFHMEPAGFCSRRSRFQVAVNRVGAESHVFL